MGHRHFERMRKLALDLSLALSLDKERESEDGVRLCKASFAQGAGAAEGPFTNGPYKDQRRPFRTALQTGQFGVGAAGERPS